MKQTPTDGLTAGPKVDAEPQKLEAKAESSNQLVNYFQQLTLRRLPPLREEVRALRNGVSLGANTTSSDSQNVPPPQNRQ